MLRKKAEDISPMEMVTCGFPVKGRPWKSQFLKANEFFFAVLSNEPKIEGHTLIISMKHFSDIADRSLADQKDDLKIAFFDIMIEMAMKLAKFTGDNKFPKVYAMSMCEHWRPKELDAALIGHITEHFHFHLLPRNKAIRTPYPHYVPEHMFVRCDKEVSYSELEKIRQKILTR